jgi:hypothetical protein
MESNEIKSGFRKDRLALISGALTLILFATKPYLLDLIEPGKSIGRIIGENAKDLIVVLNNKDADYVAYNSTRDIWSNVLSIMAFVFFALTMMLSIDLIKTESKWFGIAAIALAIIGLVVFFTYLAIGFVAFLLVAILVSVLVLGGAS